MLDISNQKKIDSGGLTGTIPDILATGLYAMNLAGNKLTGGIPDSIGIILARLKLLNLSSNALTGSIPTQLGRLEGL